jgi:hypothetical protein
VYRADGGVRKEKEKRVMISAATCISPNWVMCIDEFNGFYSLTAIHLFFTATSTASTATQIVGLKHGCFLLLLSYALSLHHTPPQLCPIR